MFTKSQKIFTVLLGIVLFVSSCNNQDPAPNNNGGSTALFNPNITYGSMTDQDGNDYKTVTIGTQTWMAENLRTTTYNDGTPITHAPGEATWAALIEGGYCVFQNKTDDAFISTYGFLYNFHAVNTGKLSPAGWHMPTNAEWNTLMNTLGGETVAGQKLRETGSMHWVNYASTVAGTNESGFTGLPGESRAASGIFPSGVGTNGHFWTATADVGTAGNAFSWDLHHGTAVATRYSEKMVRGFSVRLVKD